MGNPSVESRAWSAGAHWCPSKGEGPPLETKARPWWGGGGYQWWRCSLFYPNHLVSIFYSIRQS